MRPSREAGRGRAGGEELRAGLHQHVGLRRVGPGTWPPARDERFHYKPFPAAAFQSSCAPGPPPARPHPAKGEAGPPGSHSRDVRRAGSAASALRGPFLPRPPLRSSQARRFAVRHTEPALSGPGGLIAPNAQETHVLTCEVELLVPSVVTGRASGWRRLLEQRRREGGGHRQARRARGEVCFPETSFIYNFSSEPSSKREQENGFPQKPPFIHSVHVPVGSSQVRAPIAPRSQAPAPSRRGGPLPVRNRSCHCTTVE